MQPLTVFWHNKTQERIYTKSINYILDPCYLEYFTPWNTLVPGILRIKLSRALKEEKSPWSMCSKKLSVPKSRVFHKAKCADKQSVLDSKVFQGAECSWEQNLLRSKIFWEQSMSAKCSQYFFTLCWIGKSNSIIK